ncbi:uncharacterized protein LOC118264546 isoform X4 [Spodoptera frugiperda]|uniref:Uncharacterized protein LOC118264546 isoform X4 n=2 Tax=Spodoptera frugiperda TaxID=7108 RepID=A0A9R0EGQ4_SPOFR|nr:uncharacterized protein LOC118264546 isoform X4 [Spodoptera frugiperda]
MFKYFFNRQRRIKYHCPLTRSIEWCLWVLHCEMRALLAISLLLVCFMDQSYATFAEFMNNLPAEIVTAFSSAWDSITDVIKKPVRIKRLGPGGKLKTTTSTDEPINRHRRILMRTRTTPIIDHYEYTEAPTEGAKVTLPLLLAPTFQNYHEWSDLQKAYYTRHNLPRKLKVKNKNLIEEDVPIWAPDLWYLAPDGPNWAPGGTTSAPDDDANKDDDDDDDDDEEEEETTFDYTKEEKKKIHQLLYSMAKKKFSNIKKIDAPRNDPTLGLCKFLSRLYASNYDNYNRKDPTY